MVHDAAHIIIKQDFWKRMPLAIFYSGECNINKNCELECIMDNNLRKFASTLVYVLGDILGVGVNYEYYQCGKKIKACIMNSEVEPSMSISNCNVIAIFGILLWQKLASEIYQMQKKPQREELWEW